MKNHNLPRPLKLCRMGSSLYVTIPHALVLAHSLSAHDDILCLPVEDGIKLRFKLPVTHECEEHP